MSPTPSAATSNATTFDLSLHPSNSAQTDDQGLHEAMTYEVEFENPVGETEAVKAKKTIHIRKHYDCHDTKNCRLKLNAIMEQKLQLEAYLRDKFELVTIDVKFTIL
jgi:hypothetical protein